MSHDQSYFTVMRRLAPGRAIPVKPGGKTIYGAGTVKRLRARAERLGHDVWARRVFDPARADRDATYQVIRVLRHGPGRRIGKVRRRVVVKPAGRDRYGYGTTLRLVQRAQRLGHEVYVKKLAGYPNATHFSPNFRKSEFASRGVPVPPSLYGNVTKLCRGLEQLRDELGGAPVVIINGYRTPQHNAAVGGASRSTHLKALGADIHVPGKSQAEVVRAAARVPMFRRGGIGAYGAGGIHVDARGTVARWGANIWRILRRR